MFVSALKSFLLCTYPWLAWYSLFAYAHKNTIAQKEQGYLTISEFCRRN